MKKILTWVSQHDMNDGQLSLLPVLGYDDYKKIEVSFGDNPKKDLQKNGIASKTIGVVAPIEVVLRLLREGYTLFEFRNVESVRRKGIFICEYVNVLTLNRTIRYNCPIPLKDQTEGNLTSNYKIGEK